jgi:hypothetical protein
VIFGKYPAGEYSRERRSYRIISIKFLPSKEYN